MKLTDRIFVKFFYKKIKIIIQRSYKKGYSQGKDKVIVKVMMMVC